MLRTLRYNSPAFLWSIVILTLSLIPSRNLQKIVIWDFVGIDKVGHFGVYAILVFLLVRGFCLQFNDGIFRYSLAAYSIIIGLIYGGILEYLQWRVAPSRSGEIADFVANFLGCILGAAFYYIVSRKFNKK